MVVCFGDIHFNESKPWSLAVGEEIIKYFRESPYNNENNVAIFLGDIYDRITNTNNVTRLVLLFLSSLRFKKSYFLTGNHDLKMRSGEVVNSLSFINNSKLKDKYFPNCYLVEELKVIQEEGMNILLLPFIPKTKDRSMKEVYENLPSHILERNWDLVCGHFADTSIFVYDEMIDISKLKSKYVCLGHIHVDVGNNYIGSLVATSLAEYQTVKHFRVYQKNSITGEVSESKISIKPSFFDYEYVKYPDPLPVEKRAIITAYVINNCASESIAREKYGDIFIYKCISNFSIGNFEKGSITVDGSNTGISVKDMFNLWKEEKKESLDSDILKEVEHYFSTYSSTN